MNIDYILVLLCLLLLAITLCMSIKVFIFLKRRKRERQDVLGTLMVSTNDPDGTYIFLELDVLPEELAKRSQVVLKIKHLKPNSQK